MSIETLERIRKDCDWPEEGQFSVRDSLDEHAACLVVMPGGSCLEFCHHALNGVDQARAKFVADACNYYMEGIEANHQPALQKLYAAPGWKLSHEHINEPQIESITALIKRAKQAHFVNVSVRINGKWEEFEADWIKHMVATP
jgi:hypothetical protein